MKHFLLSILTCVLCAYTVQSSAQSALYMVSNNNNNLYSVDTATNSVSTLGGLDPVGSGSISQCNGLAVHPCTGEMFAIVQFGSTTGRSLAVIDTNANATIIGNTGDYVAAITFDNQGTLYAVTGDGGFTPETMYTVDLSDGSMTSFQTLGNGSDGEVIAYCPDNGKMYHWSGWSGSLSSLTFESINLSNNTVTNIGMTGTVSPTSIRAATYMGNGQFLVSYHSGNGIGICDTNGLLVYSGSSTTVSIKGMAFQGPNNIGVTAPVNGLCPGESTTLSATAGQSYQWYLNGNSISGATSQTYNTSTSGQYNCMIQTSTCTDSSVVGFFLDSFQLPIVSVTSNDSGFCPGGVVSISGSMGGQSQWFFNGDTIQGANSNSVLASEEGWYNMVKTNMNGCSDSASVGVYIEEFETPDVDLGGDAGICMGDSLVLDAGFFPNATYVWVPFATGQTNTVTDTGTYIAVVSSEQGCFGGDTVDIGYNPDAVVSLISDTTICDDETITLDAGAGSTTYSWTTGGSAQTEDVDINDVTSGSSVTVGVTVVNSFGCSAEDSVTISFEDCGVGISGVESGVLKIFPNPTHDLLNIYAEHNLESITVTNALGALISQNQVTGNRAQLEISTPGVYYISIEDVNGANYVEKILVQ